MLMLEAWLGVLPDLLGLAVFVLALIATVAILLAALARDVR